MQPEPEKWSEVYGQTPFEPDVAACARCGEDVRAGKCDCDQVGLEPTGYDLAKTLADQWEGQIEALQRQLVEAEEVNRKLDLERKEAIACAYQKALEVENLRAQNDEFRAALVTTQADYDALSEKLKSAEFQAREARQTLTEIADALRKPELGSWGLVEEVQSLAAKASEPQAKPLKAAFVYQSTYAETAGWLAANVPARLLFAAAGLAKCLEDEVRADG